jgi:hypothetical protein
MAGRGRREARRRFEGRPSIRSGEKKEEIIEEVGGGGGGVRGGATEQ